MWPNIGFYLKLYKGMKWIEHNVEKGKHMKDISGVINDKK